MSDAVAPLSVGKTIVAAVLILAATAIARIAVTLGVGLALGRVDLDALDHVGERTDGLLLAVGMIGAAAAGLLVTWGILRKRSPRAYLALERPDARAVGLGVLASLALVVLFDAARWLTTGVLMPPVWREIDDTAPLPLLLLAFVIVAPLFEEIFFRGFLFRGLAASRIGPAGAIAVTSILFTLAHGPEDLIGALDSLASAVLLGVIRHRTASITTGIAMHAFGNLQAIVMVGLMSAS